MTPEASLRIDSATIHLWLNVATILIIAGLVAFCGCLGATNFWGDE